MAQGSKLCRAVENYWREANNIKIRMRKWRLICHTSRKEDESIEKQALDWNSLGATRRGRPKQSGKGPFWRKQENEAKHAVMLIKSLVSK
jgi:hypothetical protein